METTLPQFLLEMLKSQYGEQITEEIIQGYSQKRVTTLRVNTLKTTTENIIKKLQEEQIEVETIPWSEQALIIKNASEKEIEQLQIYKDGEIYLQSLSSMLPPIILEPKQGNDILDMAAAPGGKTTQIAAITNNKANITACEMNKIRMERLKYNLQKQGATSVYAMEADSRKLDNFFSFDQILLDAPCSGSGTLNIEKLNREKTFTKKLIEKSVKTQTTLLRKALKLLKPGKEMIYSTCSILACENGEIVTKCLKEANAEIVPITFEGIEHLPLLPTKIEGTLVVKPTKYYEGFFVAKIKKRDFGDVP